MPVARWRKNRSMTRKTKETQAASVTRSHLVDKHGKVSHMTARFFRQLGLLWWRRYSRNPVRTCIVDVSARLPLSAGPSSEAMQSIYSPPQAYISSYSSSSSSAGGGGGFFFFKSSLRSSGHVAFNLSHGPMQSRSKRWSSWHGNWTTSGYLSAGVVVSQPPLYCHL